MNAPTPQITPELNTLLRRVKLGRCTDTLPERLALARSHNLGHAEFLELVLADEVTRRETTSAALRARAAGLDPDMCVENWDAATTNITYDRAVFDELCSLRFIEAGHNALIMGPVGVGKTFVATALGQPLYADGSAWPSRAPTCYSNGCAPRGWTTPTTPRCASSCASTC
jgi:DNA replication protein DnaC